MIWLMKVGHNASGTCALLSAGLLLAIVLEGETPKRPSPRFQDYRVVDVYHGPTKPPDFGDPSQYSGTDLRCFGGDPTVYETYRDMRVNFAGHFVLAACTCGTGCHYLFVWDAQTGRVYRDLPVGPIDVGPYGTAPHFITFTGEQYRVDSTLLVVNGCREETCDCATWYFNWRRGRLELIRKQPSRRPPACTK